METKTDDDDELDTKLDLEFRRILRIIKIYVPCIMQIDYLTSYRLWLEKLSQADVSDKQERNRYLLELCRQIQDGILEYPFREHPVAGPLPTLNRNLCNKEQIQHQQQHQRWQQQQQKQQQQQHQQQEEQQFLQHQQQQQQQQQQEQQFLQQQEQQFFQQQQQHQQLQQQQFKQQQQLQQRQMQQQQQQFFEDVIPVKQESDQNALSKELTCANNCSTSKQHIQNYQNDSENKNHLPRYPKMHIVQKDAAQMTQEHVLKSKPPVHKNSPCTEQRNKLHKKRNQHTVLRKIQEHIRHGSECKEQNDTIEDFASKFPEISKQTQTQTRPSYENRGQYMKTHEKCIIPDDCCLQNNEPQSASTYHQPYAMYTQHPENSVSGIQEVFKNPYQQIRNMNLKINDDIEEESSWCDMSEASRTATVSRMESGDSAQSLMPKLMTHPTESNCSIDPSKIHKMCENKIIDLVNIIAELKKQNLSLHAKAEVIIENLSEEVNLLKLKEQKLNEMRVGTKKPHSVASAHWKNTINDLKQTLHNAQGEIVTLQNEIIGLKGKLEKFSTQKQQDNVTIRQRLADMYDKEIDMLKQNYVRHILDIENKFTQILFEKEAAFNQRLNELREQYDRKISEISKDISEISNERCNKSPENSTGRILSGKKTVVSKYIPEKEPLEKKLRDEKRPWRKRVAVGTYRLDTS